MDPQTMKLIIQIPCLNERETLPATCGHVARRQLMTRLLPAIVILAHVGLILGNIRANFVTFDEVDHIQAGITYWETGRFDAYNVNPPLTKLLQTLPVMLFLPAEARADLRSLDFNTLTRVVETARLAGILWSLLGIWVIYRWAQQVYGGAAGLLGIVLWCFEPNITAHASLATADIAATTSSLLATYLFVRHLKAPGSWSALLAGLALGIAQATKLTLVCLYGMWLLLFLVWRSARTDREKSPSPAQVLCYAAIILASSLFIINYSYVFDGSFFRLSARPFADRRIVAVRDLLLRWFGEVRVPLPLDYVAAFDGIGRGVEMRQPAYMAGRWKDDGGWWYYYLYALSVKVPLGELILVAWNVVVTLFTGRGRRAWRDEAMLWIPVFGFLLLLSSQTGLCKHMRYVFPIFPFVMVSTAKLAVAHGGRARARRALVLALVAWSAASGLSAYPHGISYFNELAGGPADGSRCLLDSNIDWGQDLGRLKRWLDRHPEARPSYLAILHSLDPRQFGIEFRAVPPGPDGRSPVGTIDAPRLGPVPGYHALSVNFLRGMTYQMPDGQGGWVRAGRHGAFDYFQEFTPVASCGYTIVIYRITPEEANTVRARLGLPPVASEGTGTATSPGPGHRTR